MNAFIVNLPYLVSQTSFSAIITTLACTAVVILLSKAVYNVYLHPLAALPIPSIWAPLTILWTNYRIIVTRDKMYVLDKLYRTTGKSVVRVGPKEITVCDPEVAKRLMSAKWDKNPELRAFGSNGIPNSFSTVEHSQGSAKRKVILPLYSQTSIQGFEEVLLRHVGETMDYLERRKGQAVEVLSFTSHVLVDIMGEVLLGADIGCLDAYAQGAAHPVVRAVSVWALRGIIEQALPSWLWNLIARIPHEKWQVLVQSDKTIIDTVRPLAKNALERGAPETRLTLVHRLAAADGDDAETGKWTFEEILSECGAEFFAGMSTSATGLTYCFWSLANEPGIVAELRKELDELEVDERGVPSIRTVMNSPYLNGVVKEALRLYPPVNTASYRIVDKHGLAAGDHFLPPGTFVGVQTWTMHRLESIWGEDAQMFRPERWLKSQTHLQNTAWQPFSTGGRSCPGMNLALNDMRLMVAAVVRRFDIVCASDTTAESMKPVDQGAIEPAAGFCRLHFRPRE